MVRRFLPIELSRRYNSHQLLEASDMKATTPILAALVAACFSTPASAQSPDVALTGLFPVYVLDRTGEETQGRLVSLTGSAVVLQKDSATRTFNLNDVVRIDRRGDSLKNGAIIGAVFGGVVGILTAAGLADCPSAQNSCPGARVVMPIVSIGVWSAIGAGIDALIPGRTLLWKPTSSPGARQSSGSGPTVAVSAQNRSVFVGWRMR
jgi:hypothetical protein